MTSISSALPSYTPPLSAATAPSLAASQTPAPTSNTADDTNGNQAAPAATATNADDNAPDIYNAVANASASNIRGTNIDTSA